VALGEKFNASLDSVMETINRFESYNGPVLSHWPGLADRITERAFRGEPLPRDPQEQ
jgi:hypothetical protein